MREAASQQGRVFRPCFVFQLANNRRVNLLLRTAYHLHGFRLPRTYGGGTTGGVFLCGARVAMLGSGACGEPNAPLAGGRRGLAPPRLFDLKAGNRAA
jgi:hypothetical protein